MVATSFFTGWIGYGTLFNGLQISEPADGAYSRRPLSYGPLDGSCAIDLSTGSIGPAVAIWENLLFVGLFDAFTAGELLAVIPLDRPVTVLPGMTLTESRRFSFRLSVVPGSAETANLSWVAGMEIGKTINGTSVTACCNLQLINGAITALPSSSTPLTTTALPSIAPASGSGQLWNNGGVICIA